jgi:histidinol-phosphate phosphatase family protein
MKRYDCIFLDRDGTLNPDPGYIKCINEFQFYNFTIKSLIKLAKNRNRFCIVSNQSGISRGLIAKKDLDEVHLYIKGEFKKYNIPLLEIFIATDHPDTATDRRKPGLGMFLEAQDKFSVNLKKSLMIGDSYGDMESARLLGMDRMLVLTGLGLETLSSIAKKEIPTYVVKNLSFGANILCQ